MFKIAADGRIVGFPDDGADGNGGEIDGAGSELKFEICNLRFAICNWMNRIDPTPLLVLLRVAFIEDDAIVGF